MENNLYLLEVFVGSMDLPVGDDKQPIKSSDVIVTAEMNSHRKMQIVSIHGAEQLALQFDCGKSILFASTPEALLKEMKTTRLTLAVQIKGIEIGIGAIPYPESILEMVQETRPANNRPENKEELVWLHPPNSETDIIGNMIVNLRFYSFGTNLQTNYQKIESESSKGRYFMRTSRTFSIYEYQKVKGVSGMGVPPVAPLLPDQSLDHNNLNDIFSDTTGANSWMTFFNSNLDPKASQAPMDGVPVFHNVQANSHASQYTVDIISIRERPGENKCLDLRVHGGSQGFSFDYDRVSAEKELAPPQEDLGIDRINQLLCKNKDCPAAKKFKEFGIGPLANIKGLGTVHQVTHPTTSYGLSQTYGTFENYGPYGLFTRPKRPEEPFIPKPDSEDWSKDCWKPKRRKLSEDSLRLRGGVGDSFCDDGVFSREVFPLRLRGGGIFDYDDIKSPFYECREVLNQYDDVLEKFRKSMGPCGTTTCPYAPNVIIETCKRVCPGKNYEEVKLSQSAPIPESSVCLKPKGPKRAYESSACGSPKCPYAHYKAGLMDEDAALELQFLPPALSGKCGHPKCPIPVEPKLEPIHWDCPEALPKGPCKNPNCPYLPDDLRSLNKIVRGGVNDDEEICGNPDCPYAMPSPCDSPDCPFNTKKCPYEDEEDDCGEDMVDCENPDCPYVDRTRRDSSVCYQEPIKVVREVPEPEPLCQPAMCPLYMENLVRSILTAITVCMNQNGNLNTKNILNMCMGGPECPYTKGASGSDAVQERPPEPALEDVCEMHGGTHDCDCSPSNCALNPLPENLSATRQDNAVQSTQSQMVAKGYRTRIEDDIIQIPGQVEYLSESRIMLDNIPCYPDTCKLHGGLQECGCTISCCGLPVAEIHTQATSPGGSKKRRKKRSKYVYAIGEKYPGIQIGHKECVIPSFNVPPRMGWLWNIHVPCMSLKPRRGWRPGAIGRTMAKTIERHREAQGLKMLKLKNLRTGKKGYGMTESQQDMAVIAKPTLQIKKRDGCYWITMNPLKDPKSLVENENPYMDCTPMQFKIVRNKDKLKVSRGDGSDYKTCFCGDDGDGDGNEDCSTSSDSELDIEFTPPAGLIHPERFLRKRNVVHCDTQYMSTDFEPHKVESKIEKKEKKGKKGKKDKKGKKGKKGKKK